MEKINLVFGLVIAVLVVFFGVAILYDYANSGDSGPDALKSGTLVGKAVSAYASESNTGKVKIVEFSEFQCPYCAKAAPTVKRIKEEYGDDVEIVFKHFPLNFHRYAQKAAEASECARDQGEFSEYHDILFENQRALDISSLKKYAKDLGLDSERFNSCLDSGEKTSLVQNDLKEGQSRGVSETPTFFINDQMVVGAQPYEVFKEIIDLMIEVSDGNSGGGELEDAEPLSDPNQPLLREVNPDSPDEGTKIGTFRIDGMSCGGCLSTIRQALSKVNGVEKYDVYLGYPGKAVVEYDSGIVSSQGIADAITNSGYPATIISKEDAEKISGTTSAASCGSPTCGGSSGGGCGCGG